MGLLRTIIRSALIIALAGTGGQSLASAGLLAPKLALVNGHIRTPTGWAEALAVNERGVIAAIGASASVRQTAGSGARLIDLQGRTVLPGFHDRHVHPIFAGLQAQRCVIPQGATLKSLQEQVLQCAERARPGAWITGGQWDAPALGRTPEHALLDSVSLGHPVLLGDTSEHSAWANAKALQIAGITQGTPNPPLGIIERDGAGEPTGVLREDAVLLVRRHVPLPTEEEIQSALSSSAREMLSYGITSFTEAAAGYSAGLQKEIGAYTALADSGTLKQRVRVCLSWSPGDLTAERFIATANLYSRPQLSVDCVKIFLDGVPTDSHTAAMLEPYQGKVAGRADEASRTGMLLVPQNILNHAVTRFDRLGLTVKFHAAGDAAVRAGLDAIEAARKANGFSGVLHDVGHCTFVSRNDIPRARAIGATFEVSPYLWSPSPINESISEAVGPVLIQRVWPVREMLDAGALVVAGSDWSVVPSVNPWPAVEALVTRERPGGSADSFGKAEAITLEEALRLFTVNAARHLHTEGRLGALEVGKLADLVVLDRDPYSIPARQLHNVQVIGTYIGGELVYTRSQGERE
jgi:predicted amidohydrolase YtcJ